jgi:ATP-dependent helicase/nuclease subunit A
MEYLDFSNPDFIGQVKGMVDSGIVSAEQVEKISLEKMENAVKCKALSGIVGKSLYREKCFLVGIEANKLFDTTSQEMVVLQGIIDLLVVDGDNIKVIDYKYSQRVKDSLKSKYKKQLELYSYAAEKVLNKKVVSKTIVNLLTGESVEI